MTKRIKTSITIDAQPEKVWAILTNYSKYPDWNPFIKSIEGEVGKGKRIQVKIQKMTFRPTILTFTPQRELKWLGHLGFKGLFDGEHQFLLHDNGNGTTRFEQNETFSGILVKLFPQSLYSDTQKGFETMNSELKKIVETTTTRSEI